MNIFGAHSCATLRPMGGNSNKAPARKARKKFCAHTECRLEAITVGYCRLHYLAHWKDLQGREKVKAAKRLNAYVERFAKKFPSDFIEKIREDIDDENKFKESVQEVEVGIDETEETENQFIEKFKRVVKIE